MLFRAVLGLIVILIFCTCIHQPSKRIQTNENGSIQHQVSKSGLLFEHGGYRGTGYTDSLGNNYNLRNNPVTITNDSTISINVQIAFLTEYDYPIGYDNEQFKIIPLPEGWAQEGTTDSEFDSLWDEFPIHLNKPILSKTLEPGEKFVLAIGTLYPLPAEIWWVVPNELFANNKEGMFPMCDWQMNKDPLSNSEIPLGLKLHLGEGCMIIPCGQISYPNQ